MTTRPTTHPGTFTVGAATDTPWALQHIRIRSDAAAAIPDDDCRDLARATLAPG